MKWNVMINVVAPREDHDITISENNVQSNGGIYSIVNENMSYARFINLIQIFLFFRVFKLHVGLFHLYFLIDFP